MLAIATPHSWARFRQITWVMITIASLSFPFPAIAQTVSDEIAQELADQGFTIVSTRYTWLRRIVVTASDGTFERELLVTRGTGVVLQDKWQRIEDAGNAPALRRSETTKRPAYGAGQESDGQGSAPPKSRPAPHRPDKDDRPNPSDKPRPDRPDSDKPESDWSGPKKK